MTLFADSSALVTRYADESGRPAMGDGDTLIVSQLCRVEIPAAIWRKHRIGALSSADASVLVAAFEADYAGSVDAAAAYVVVLVTQPILDQAVRFVRIHGLRAYDAVQLSSAAAVADVVPECRTFAGYDRQLRDAAAAEGFLLFPAEL